MLSWGLVVTVASLYLFGLFVIAFVSDRRAKLGRGKLINSPVVYTLSLAVYCTSWTFYGAVGSAARGGLEYITIYIGPMLVLVGWTVFLRKLVRISRQQRITSIADFISARYGKSPLISALVTIMALIGVMPYIALQLKAVAASFDALGAAEGWGTASVQSWSLFADTGFWVAVCMAFFVIIFGTRNLGADEHHPGIIAAIAFESLVKLLSMAAIAAFVVYGLNNGVADMFANAQDHPGVRKLQQFDTGFETRWIVLTFLSATAIVCLPRQFQVAVVENTNEKALATASWLFPLYLLLVSLFVIPIAIGGMTGLPAGANPDLFILTVPLANDQQGLALLAFIGGLSAATSMVIVASIALAIMISNHLVTPLLLYFPHYSGTGSGEVSTTLLLVRRISIVVVLTLGFLYYRLTGTSSPLASIGLISFVGVAQFLPALAGGVFWNRATKAGATAGLMAGFAMWFYTLLAPSFADTSPGLGALVDAGPWGIALLMPTALFGFGDWDPLVHGLFWSMTMNVGLFVLVSLGTRQSPLERLQSAVFVDTFRSDTPTMDDALQRSATTADLVQLSRRVLGHKRTHDIFAAYARRQGRDDQLPAPDAGLIALVERELAGTVGAASARSLLSTIVKGETISLTMVIALLDETQQAISHSRELERKSRELEQAAAQLRRANEQLTRLDRMKDDFLSQVSHELRTPMTSIRSFSAILTSSPELDNDQARHFAGIIQHESERLTRLLDQILELNRLENGEMDWTLERNDAAAIMRSAIETMRGLAHEHRVAIHDLLGTAPIAVMTDPDRLKQVCINLLSNAIKFNKSTDAAIWIRCTGPTGAGEFELHVVDNGRGITPEHQASLFSKLSRGWNLPTQRPEGSGLGLAISRQIMQHMGGDLVLVRSDATGSCFAMRFPAVETLRAARL
jgi:Na+/proline symporter/nitrogen-specific signal transduction histidine kinase